MRRADYKEHLPKSAGEAGLAPQSYLAFKDGSDDDLGGGRKSRPFQGKRTKTIKTSRCEGHEKMAHSEKRLFSRGPQDMVG